MKCDELNKVMGMVCERERHYYNANKVDEAFAELKTKLAEEKEFGLNRAKSADHEIGKLTEEIIKLRKELAELREATMWRKYPEEKPCSDGYYIICGSSGFRNADRFMECEDGRGMDFSFYSYGVEYWMPMPKTPEVK